MWAWLQKLVDFWKANLEKNILRISIALGSLLIFLITMIPFPDTIAGVIVAFAALIIMSIFGKNGNGVNGDLEEEKKEEN